jgi:hypothetical protein
MVSVATPTLFATSGVNFNTGNMTGADILELWDTFSDATESGGSGGYVAGSGKPVNKVVEKDGKTITYVYYSSDGKYKQASDIVENESDLGTYNALLGGSYDYGSTISQTAMDRIHSVYSGIDYMDTFQTFIQVDFEDKDNIFYKLWNTDQAALKGLYEISKIIGVGMCVLFFLMDLLRKATDDALTPKSFVMSLCRLLLGYWLILNLFDGEEIIPLFVKLFSTGIINSALNPTYITYGELAELQTMADYGFMEALSGLIDTLTPSLCITASKAVVIANALGRIVELYVLCTFAPIGVANVFSGRGDSAGIRYIKKIIAVALQGAIMLAILVAMSTIQMQVTGLEIAFGFASAALVSRSRNIANEIMSA